MSLITRQEEAYQVPFEIESLQKLVASKKPQVIVEIGSANGGTIPRWLFIEGVRTVVSVDLPGGKFGGVSAEEKEIIRSECEEYATAHGFEFHQILGDSHEKSTVNKLEESLLGRQIDFLFIDGDHSYAGVLNDFAMYSGMVKEGGLIAFHDILNSKFHKKSGSYVQALWHRLKKMFASVEFITDDKEEYKRIMPWSYPSGFGGIGVIRYEKQIFQRFLAKKNLSKQPGDLAIRFSGMFRKHPASKSL